MQCMHMRCPPLSLYLYCRFPLYINTLVGFNYNSSIEKEFWIFLHEFCEVIAYYIILFINFYDQNNNNEKQKWVFDFNIHLQSLYEFRSTLCHAAMRCWSSKAGEGKLSNSTPPPLSPFLWVELPHIDIYVCSHSGCIWLVTGFLLFYFFQTTDVAFSPSKMPPCVIKRYTAAFRQHIHELWSLSCGFRLSVRPNLHH